MPKHTSKEMSKGTSKKVAKMPVNPKKRSVPEGRPAKRMTLANKGAK